MAQSADAIPRVVLLGRLSLYGKGAVRLHEEMLTVTARWSEPSGRRGPLSAYSREAEAKTLELLEDALRRDAGGKVAEQVRQRLLATIPRDIEELLPQLERRATDAKADAEKRLAERGRAESESMRRILEEQSKRVAEQAGRTAQLQLDLFNEEEKRQLESNGKYW